MSEPGMLSREQLEECIGRGEIDTVITGSRQLPADAAAVKGVWGTNSTRRLSPGYGSVCTVLPPRELASTLMNTARSCFFPEPSRATRSLPPKTSLYSAA